MAGRHIYGIQRKDLPRTPVATFKAPQFAAVAYAIMISTLTRSASSAITGAVGIGLLVESLKYHLGVEKFIFSTYLDTPWMVFQKQCDGLPAQWFPLTAQALVVALAWLMVFASVAAFTLSRRNLQA